MSKEELVNRDEVLDVVYNDDGTVRYLEVQDYGNITFFSSLDESDELYRGNISTINGNLKVNIRADKSKD